MLNKFENVCVIEKKDPKYLQIEWCKLFEAELKPKSDWRIILLNYHVLSGVNNEV